VEYEEINAVLTTDEAMAEGQNPRRLINEENESSFRRHPDGIAAEIWPGRPLAEGYVDRRLVGMRFL